MVEIGNVHYYPNRRLFVCIDYQGDIK